MATDWKKRCLLLLPVLCSVLMSACCKPSPPQPPRVVTVRESCLRVQPPPNHVEEILNCSAQGNELQDCIANALMVRDVWIAAAWARCQVAE